MGSFKDRGMTTIRSDHLHPTLAFLSAWSVGSHSPYCESRKCMGTTIARPLFCAHENPTTCVSIVEALVSNIHRSALPAEYPVLVSRIAAVSESEQRVANAFAHIA